MTKGCEAGGRVPAIGRREFIQLGAGAVMALNAPKASAQRGTGRPVSIDVHAHWAPEAYTNALTQLDKLPSSSPPLILTQKKAPSTGFSLAN